MAECNAKKEKKRDEEWTFVKGSRSRVLNLPRLFYRKPVKCFAHETSAPR